MASRWRGPLAWAVLIEVLLLWPHPPHLPRSWYSFPLFAVIGIDTCVHAFLFGVLAALLARALSAGSRSAGSRPAWTSFAMSALFGAFTEFQQYLIPSRSMALGDFLADATGAALGLAAYTIWAQRRREISR